MTVLYVLDIGPLQGSCQTFCDKTHKKARVCVCVCVRERERHIENLGEDLVEDGSRGGVAFPRKVDGVPPPLLSGEERTT